MRVPADLPSDRVASWADGVVAELRRRHPDLPLERSEAVRRTVLNAHDGLLPGAALGLLYLPDASGVGLLVSVGVSEPQAIEGALVRALLGEAELLGRPIVDPVEVPELGTGISVRCLFAPADGRKPAAGLAYLLQGERATVRVMASPAPQELVAAAAPSLAKIVASFRLVD